MLLRRRLLARLAYLSVLALWVASCGDLQDHGTTAALTAQPINRTAHPLSPVPSSPPTGLPASPRSGPASEPNSTPLSRPEPISWVGPLLYTSFPNKDLRAIPVFDLGTGQVRWLSTAEPVWTIADWSPDGCYVMYHTSSGVRIINVSTAQDYPLAAPGQAWSPTGEWIAYSGHEQPSGCSQVCLIRPDNSETRQITHHGLSRDRVYRIDRWSVDGRQVLYRSQLRNPSAQQGTQAEIWELKVVDIGSLEEGGIARYVQPLESWADLVVTDVSTMQRVPLQMPGEPENADVVGLFWSPGFRHLAIFTAQYEFEVYENVRLYLLDVESRRVQAINTTGFWVVGWPSQSRNGVRLAIQAEGLDEQTSESVGIFVLDLARGTFEALGPEVGVPAFSPAWSPDGTMLSFATEQGWAIYDFSTREVTRLLGSLSEAFNLGYDALSWSPRATYGPGACQGGE